MVAVLFCGLYLVQVANDGVIRQSSPFPAVVAVFVNRMRSLMFPMLVPVSETVMFRDWPATPFAPNWGLRTPFVVQLTVKTPVLQYRFACGLERGSS